MFKINNISRWIFLLIPMLFIIVSCGKKTVSEEKPKQFCLSDTMVKMISIDTVKQCQVESELQLSGEVSFDENTVVKVFPNSSGKVIECPVTLGDKVVKGQILAIIKSADVAGNYSDLTSLNADVSIARRQLENAESLFKNGIASEKEYEEAKQNYQKALAAKQKVTDLIVINGGGNTRAGGVYYIKAPISGFIVEKKVNAGSFIRQDMADNMFTISDLKNIWIYANVFEADISKIKEGDMATITTLSYGDRQFHGHIDKVNQVLDPQNKAMKIRIRLDNRDFLLKPEMFTNVTILQSNGESKLCVPTSSLINQDGKNYVVLMNNNCDMKIVEVTVLKISGEKTFIYADLKPGQRIITQNQLLIFNQIIVNN